MKISIKLDREEVKALGSILMKISTQISTKGESITVADTIYNEEIMNYNLKIWGFLLSDKKKFQIQLPNFITVILFDRFDASIYPPFELSIYRRILAEIDKTHINFLHKMACYNQEFKGKSIYLQ